MPREQVFSIAATVALAIAAALFAIVSANNGWPFRLAVSVGALGGLMHEFAQSGGKILFFRKQDDGYYLGSVAGMVLGSVAGILVVRGHALAQSGTDRASLVELGYEVFMAGLALKGVAEAAGGTPVDRQSEPAVGAEALNRIQP